MKNKMVMAFAVCALLLLCGCPRKIPEAGTEKALLFSAAGDVIIMGHSVGETVSAGRSYSFKDINALARTRDVMLVNLETALDYNCIPQSRPHVYKIAPEVLSALIGEGVNAFSLANDHALDCGRDALDQLILAMSQANLYPVGAGRTLEQARAPVYITRNDVTLGITAYTMLETPGIEACDKCVTVASLDRSALLHSLGEMNKRSNYQIIMIQWGRNDQKEPAAEFKTIAAEALDFGAEVVIGVGPRLPMSVQRVRGRWMLYSLGSFLFEDEPGNSSTGLIFSAEFSTSGMTNPRLLPVRFNAGRLEILRGANAEPLFREIMENADQDTRTHLSMVEDILYLR